jgi:hypothetical protein
MSDPLADHLEMMTDMCSSRHWNHSSAYATTDSQEEEADELYQALLAAHSQLYVTTVGQIRERGE